MVIKRYDDFVEVTCDCEQCRAANSWRERCTDYIKAEDEYNRRQTEAYYKRPACQWTVGQWYMTRDGGLAQYLGKWPHMDLHNFRWVPEIPGKPSWFTSRHGIIDPMTSPGGYKEARKRIYGFDVVTDDTTL